MEINPSKRYRTLDFVILLDSFSFLLFFYEKYCIMQTHRVMEQSILKNERTSGNFLRKTTSSLASTVFSNTIFPSREANTTPPWLHKHTFSIKSVIMNRIAGTIEKLQIYNACNNYAMALSDTK
jgi:hypothetical protein